MAAMARVKIPSASGPSTCITMHLYTASRMHASAADRPSNLVRLHDMSETQAVPQRFRPVLSALIDMIAEGDVAAMRADPAIRVGVSDPLLWVRDYPGAVTSLPPQGWDLADAGRQRSDEHASEHQAPCHLVCR